MAQDLVHLTGLSGMWFTTAFTLPFTLSFTLYGLPRHFGEFPFLIEATGGVGDPHLSRHNKCKILKITVL